MCVRRALRSHGFLAETFYFEERELRDGSLATRFQKYPVDAVVWFLPSRASRETIARLRDAGTRVVE